MKNKIANNLLHKLEELEDIFLVCLVKYDKTTDTMKKPDSIKDISVVKLKRLCYREPDLMHALKSIYLDLCMLRWDSFNDYIGLAEYTDMVFLIEQTVMGILLEEIEQK